MLTIRPAEWPQDIALLSALEPSFATDRIYRVALEGFSFQLVEKAVTPPIKKRYDFDVADETERAAWHFASVAEEAGQLAGFVALEHQLWNNRVNIRHLYVQPAFRRRGVGRRLMDQVDVFAQSVKARSLWLETQNINYPAIQFYLRVGFRLCGFDTALYDPKNVLPGEIALFFDRPVQLSR